VLPFLLLFFFIAIPSSGEQLFEVHLFIISVDVAAQYTQIFRSDFIQLFLEKRILLERLFL
jgi:hypothetical protein